MLNNKFAHRYGIVPLVAFSLFQTPLNISGDVALREHLVFSALVSSFSRQEKPEEAIETSDKNFFVSSCLCLCCCCCYFVFSRFLFLFASLMQSLEKAGFFLEQLISLFVSLYMFKV